MSAKKYFENITIKSDSPLVKYLKIQPGDYWGKFDPLAGKLFLKNKKEKNNNSEILELNVTLEELLVILTSATRVEQDKVIIARISNFSSKKKGFIAHHVIPIEVCGISNLTLQAKQRCVFDENSVINRLLVPVHFHKGSHPDYSNFVLDILEEEWSDILRKGLEYDNEVIKDVLIDITAYLKDKINEWIATGICSINDV